MTQPNTNHGRGSSFWAPGTVLLKDLNYSLDKVVLHPTPTSDPNDPLNWAKWRKSLNFVLVLIYVFMTFVQLDIGFTAWEQYQTELGFTISLLNSGAATNYASLAVGCIFLVPFVHKYGRRFLYIFSTLIQLVACIWSARTTTQGDLIGSSLLSGLGGALSETIVQISIADIFFVHNHAAMNGWYLFATLAGSYLGPISAGYIVDGQGWRWMWWWCAILFSINLGLIIIAFEESKYVTPGQGQQIGYQQNRGMGTTTMDTTETDPGMKPVHSHDEQRAESTRDLRTRSHVLIDHRVQKRTYRQRMAPITKTDDSLLHHLYQPAVILFRLPAVAYAAVTYGSLLAWSAILISIQATYLFKPPYNFSASGVGLMSLAPLVGSIPGIYIGGYLNDQSVLWLSRRNGGVFEPEMRLWLALPSAVICPAGILVFGLGLHNGARWPVLAVGVGTYIFGLVIAADIALSYVMSCYRDLIGNALVGIVFVRNMISVPVLFGLAPWLSSMGLVNFHILLAALCFAFLLLPIPLLIWGKRIRGATASKYRDMASRQPIQRDFQDIHE